MSYAKMYMGGTRDRDVDYAFDDGDRDGDIEHIYDDDMEGHPDFDIDFDFYDDLRDFDDDDLSSSEYTLDIDSPNFGQSINKGLTEVLDNQERLFDLSGLAVNDDYFSDNEESYEL